jgi:8-oxo-dGTP pyrophosphatase MutT (NUDIX family)
MERREARPDGLERQAFKVRAAGGVVWRKDDRDCPEVCIVHRPRYDDWSLPKGKLDAGESFEDAALREVEEEISVRARLSEELPPATYRDHKGRPKLVRYWLMEIETDLGFVPNDEVDEVRWCSPAEAARCVTYPFDAELLVTVAEILA